MLLRLPSFTAQPLLLLVFAAWLFIPGCKQTMQGDIPANSLLIYMAADNNLDASAWEDINELEAGLAESGTSSQVLVYVDGRSANPILLKIVPDRSSSIISPVVHTWPEHSSADVKVFGQVIRHVINSYPSYSHGLVLWSHGTGWIPSSYETSLLGSKPEGEDTKSWSLDEHPGPESQLDITLLAQALPQRMSFIAFDACYMGSIEVFWELKNAADYLLASPSEILSFGFPYKDMIGDLVGNAESLRKAAQVFFESYNSRKGALRSASVVLVDTAKLDNLAIQTRKLMPKLFDGISEKKDSIQQYQRKSEGYFYDMKDLVLKSLGHVPVGFSKALADAVLYSAHTPSFMEQLSFDEVSGLSMYISDGNQKELMNLYSQLGWYKDVLEKS